LTESAAADLLEVISFIAAESPAITRRLVIRLRSRAASPERIPQRDVTVGAALDGRRTWRILCSSA
jgi:hypothetical protein